ncbi:MAG TPA: hypothetical protein VGP87_00360 [Gemmatimonadales bacterium]|nr:hypothetical protein [Gemmatimonadales bacterium]
MKTLMRYGAFTCAIILGACGKDAAGPNVDTPLVTADLAVVAADAAGEDVDIMREPVVFPSMAATFAPGNGDFNPVNCTYNTTTQRLECPPFTRDNSLVVTRSYMFWDAFNVVQQAYDALLTAKANVQTDIQGTRTTDRWSAEIHRSRDLTVTGLLGTETERTWNGTGVSEATRSRHTDGGDRSYDISCTLTVNNVVVPVERGDERFPTGGTITRVCLITFVGGPRDGQTVTRTAVVTFNGSETATLTIGDKTFDIDLKSRNRTPRP